MKGEIREGKGAAGSIHVCGGVLGGCREGMPRALFSPGGRNAHREGRRATVEAAQPSKTIPTQDPPLGA